MPSVKKSQTRAAVKSVHKAAIAKEFGNKVADNTTVAVPGYEELADVLRRAYHQAAHGKGKERHAQPDEAFKDQLIVEGAHRYGVGALLFQAHKKAEESQRLPHDRAVAEILGAIVYLSGAIITMEQKRDRLVKANGINPQDL